MPSGQMTDSFSLAFDFHDAKARSLPNDPITGGGETHVQCCRHRRRVNVWSSIPIRRPGPSRYAAMAPVSGIQEFQFNDGLPVAARTLFPTTSDALAGTNGNANYTFDAGSLGSQVLRINYQGQETDLQQARLDGALEFDEGRFQFGVETRELETSSELRPAT